jgi:hypothetical protein
MQDKIVISSTGKLYTSEEVKRLLYDYAHLLGQREGQHLPTIAPLEKFCVENGLTD